MFNYKDRYENVDIANAPKSQRIALTVFLLVFALAAFGFAISAVNGNNHANMVRTSGVRTTATVDNRYENRSRDGQSAYYYIVVGYSVNGVPAEHRFEISRDAYKKTYNRPATDVYYLPSDPSQVVLADGGDVNTGASQMIAPFTIGIVTLAVIAFAWIYWIRNGVP